MKYLKNKKKSKSKAKSKKNTIERQIIIRKNGTRRASDDDGKPPVRHRGEGQSNA